MGSSYYLRGRCPKRADAVSETKKRLEPCGSATRLMRETEANTEGEQKPQCLSDLRDGVDLLQLPDLALMDREPLETETPMPEENMLPVHQTQRLASSRKGSSFRTRCCHIMAYCLLSWCAAENLCPSVALLPGGTEFSNSWYSFHRHKSGWPLHSFSKKC